MGLEKLVSESRWSDLLKDRKMYITKFNYFTDACNSDSYHEVVTYLQKLYHRRNKPEAYLMTTLDNYSLNQYFVIQYE